ncbi:hypothetical protein [Flavobacterium sp. fv08]|uniref:hypothetical protein n=1 Tax=Flavobacterium sp. fv08 TaxID=1761784 RepID=UPI0008C3B1A4|nr:hypothetical protein [Flavobacterium sp. fv08]SEP06100.1 hypothetical protein SAMN04487978_4349 [Flavobacterium sp. fv08]
MTYKQKLEELKKNAVAKLEIRNKIEAGFTNDRTYTRIQFDQADYDHKSAVNDFQELQLFMKSNGFSESDKI